MPGECESSFPKWLCVVANHLHTNNALCAVCVWMVCACVCVWRWCHCDSRRWSCKYLVLMLCLCLMHIYMSHDAGTTRAMMADACHCHIFVVRRAGSSLGRVSRFDNSTQFVHAKEGEKCERKSSRKWVSFAHCHCVCVSRCGAATESEYIIKHLFNHLRQFWRDDEYNGRKPFWIFPAIWKFQWNSNVRFVCASERLARDETIRSPVP